MASKAKRVIQIDADTGEVYDDAFMAVLFPKRRNGFSIGGWLAMAQEAAKLLAQSDLTGSDFKVLMYLFSVLQIENAIIVSQSEIAKELNMRRQNVSRSIKRLISIGVILEGPRIGVSRSYSLSAEFGWKGNGQNHVIALEEERKKRMTKT